MRYISVKITSCDDDCPYMDLFWHDDADGWCCKSEREIDSVKSLPDWCELDKYETERECRCASRT